MHTTDPCNNYYEYCIEKGKNKLELEESPSGVGCRINGGQLSVIVGGEAKVQQEGEYETEIEEGKVETIGCGAYVVLDLSVDSKDPDRLDDAVQAD